MYLLSEELLERYRSRKSIICSLRDIDFCTVVRCFFCGKDQLWAQNGSWLCSNVHFKG